MNKELEAVKYFENIKEYHKQYYNDNKDKIITSSKSYYENNKEHCTERMKQYREENKEVLNQKKIEKIVCECGATITRSNLATHKKSNKHIKALPN